MDNKLVVSIILSTGYSLSRRNLWNYMRSSGLSILRLIWIDWVARLILNFFKKSNFYMSLIFTRTEKILAFLSCYSVTYAPGNSSPFSIGISIPRFMTPTYVLANISKTHLPSNLFNPLSSGFSNISLKLSSLTMTAWTYSFNPEMSTMISSNLFAKV